MKVRRPTTRGQERRLRLLGCYKIARWTPGRTRWQALGYALPRRRQAQPRPVAVKRVLRWFKPCTCAPAQFGGRIRNWPGYSCKRHP